MSSTDEIQSNLCYAENVLSAILQMKSFGVNVHSMQITLRRLLNEISLQALDSESYERLKQMEAAVQSNLDPFFSLKRPLSLPA